MDVVYLKLPQEVQVVNRKIYLKDVAEIYCEEDCLAKRIGDMILYTVKGDKNEKIVFSVMKIIRQVQKECPGIQIESIGESDFILEYKMPKADQKVMERCKLILVSLIVFLGSAFTIMTFNTDVSVEDVFDNLYRLILGHKKDSAIMEAAYSIGIFVGILGFYNHFKGSKLKNDPTPIHIEMRNYEEEMNKAIIKNADRENETKK